MTAFMRARALLQDYLTPDQWQQAITGGQFEWQWPLDVSTPEHQQDRRRWMIPLNPNARVVYFARPVGQAEYIEQWCMGPLEAECLSFPDVALTRLAWLQAEPSKTWRRSNRAPLERPPNPDPLDAFRALLATPPRMLADAGIQDYLARALWSVITDALPALLAPASPLMHLELAVVDCPLDWVFPTPAPAVWQPHSERTAEQEAWWYSGHMACGELCTALVASDFPAGMRVFMELQHAGRRPTQVRLILPVSLIRVETWLTSTQAPAHLAPAAWAALQAQYSRARSQRAPARRRP